MILNQHKYQDEEEHAKFELLSYIFIIHAIFNSF